MAVCVNTIYSVVMSFCLHVKHVKTHLLNSTVNVKYPAFAQVLAYSLLFPYFIEFCIYKTLLIITKYQNESQGSSLVVHTTDPRKAGRRQVEQRSRL